MVLVQDVSTHWNSTYLMLTRILALKRSVQLYLSENEVVKISSDEFQLIDKITNLLKPFFELTQIMSSEVTSLSTVIPSLLPLEKYLERTESNGV